MFRHPSNPSSNSPPDDAKQPSQEGENLKKAEKPEPPSQAGDDPKSLKDLLEKNLKWSQIIYEQNRRINRKLLWASVAGWVRLVIIVIPLILAIWFLPPLVSDIFKGYENIFGGSSSGDKKADSSAIDRLLKLLPLGPAEEQKIKAMLK